MTILQGRTVFVKNVELLYWFIEYTRLDRYRHSELLTKVSLSGQTLALRNDGTLSPWGDFLRFWTSQGV